jgi:hypothetical protein
MSSHALSSGYNLLMWVRETGSSLESTNERVLSHLRGAIAANMCLGPTEISAIADLRSKYAKD